MEINFAPGDTVRVYPKAKGGGKEKLPVFQGVVLAIRGRGENKSFTVRKIASGGIGVERIWPIASPTIEKVVVVKKPKKRPRRAKLYYLRGIGRK